MKQVTILSFILVSSVLFSCTKLEEEFRGEIEQNNSSTVTAADLLKSAYSSLDAAFSDPGQLFASGEHTSDAALGPTRGPDWDDNGVWRAMHLHTWNADNSILRGIYTNLLNAQFAASNVLQFNPSAQQAAEARYIRALTMFMAMDGWDQVPYREDLSDYSVLPTTLTGTAVVDFVIAELNEILGQLPDGPASTANKNAARVLMMKCYLNKGAFANRAAPTFDNGDMNSVISLADAVTGYALNDNYFDNFGPDNTDLSTENIYTLFNQNGIRGFGAQHRWYMVLHYNQRPSGWNGFATLSDFYDKFEDADERRGGDYEGTTDVSGLKVGFLYGQQYDQNGVALKDRKGAPLFFTREVAIKESGTNLEVTGIRVIKYPADYAHEFPSDNDMVIFRYPDVLLMKAEALLRTGDAAGALTIVNNLRTQRGASAFASVDLAKLLDERGRELYWEGWRRQDLIRFGKYLEPWQEKPTDDPKNLLFPIPSNQLAVNSNLVQNPGY
ncbi:RagB/SusD family nutrient uptake outer membrane protein [soil metagenome]